MGLYTDLITKDEKKTTAQQQAKPVISSAPKTRTRKNTTSKHTSKQTSTHVRKQTSKHVTMRAYLEKLLTERASHSFTFRYPPDLLEELEDVVYEIKKKHRKRLPKNVVAVLALAYILKDYVENGDESVFYKILIGK